MCCQAITTVGDWNLILMGEMGGLEKVWLNNSFNYDTFCLKTMHILGFFLESQLLGTVYHSYLTCT